jgi:predicted metalloendopeptidase
MKQLLVIVATLLLLTSCSKLSSEAKEIIGTYYNAHLSKDIPVFELRKDGTCTVRNIQPDVLVLEVSGTWNVDNDTLIVVNNLSTVKATGDTSIIGNISPILKRKVVSHDEMSLVLEREGIEYVFNRK